jgi:hypothetical protein
MVTPLDPTAAQQALAAARQQQANAIRATRTPWWTWLVAFLMVWMILLSRDFRDQWWIAPAVVCVLLAWTRLPRLWPALAVRLGTPVQLHQRAVPLRLRAISFGVSMAVAIVVVLGVDYAGAVRSLGGSPWAVAHPHVVLGPLAALAVAVAGWLTERLARGWLLRHTR